MFNISILMFESLHFGNETLGGLEGGQVVRVNHQSRVFRYVAGCLLSTMLDDEAAEATQIDILLI
jgi:hypothetical protein